MVTIATPSSRAYSISSLTRFSFPIRQRDMPSIERSLAYPNAAGASRAQSRRLARGLIERSFSIDSRSSARPWGTDRLGRNGRMRVLVLGGNRYIGLSLVRELARCGFEVTVANSHEAEL